MLKASAKFSAQQIVSLVAAHIRDARAELLSESSEISAIRADSDVKSFRRGRPSTNASTAQKQITQLFDRISDFYPELKSETTFRVYLGKLALQHYNEGHFKEDNLRFSEAFIDHAAASYTLLRRAGVSKRLFLDCVHKFSFNQVVDIINQVDRVFGASPSTKTLRGTAISMILQGVYSSASEAKKAFQKIESELSKIFSEHGLSEVSRSAAVKVFTGTYKNYEVALKASFTRNAALAVKEEI